MSLVDTKLLIDFLKKVRGFLQENEITCYDDLDNVFFRLFGKVDFFPEPYGNLYSYLDVVIDAKEHSFETISDHYTYGEAIKDLNFIIKQIEENNIDEISNETFTSKLKKVYK
jgi:hypothetical protein